MLKALILLKAHKFRFRMTYLNSIYLIGGKIDVLADKITIIIHHKR